MSTRKSLPALSFDDLAQRADEVARAAYALREQLRKAPVSDEIVRSLLLSLSDEAWWAASTIAKTSVALWKREGET